MFLFAENCRHSNRLHPRRQISAKFLSKKTTAIAVVKTEAKKHKLGLIILAPFLVHQVRLRNGFLHTRLLTSIDVSNLKQQITLNQFR